MNTKARTEIAVIRVLVLDEERTQQKWQGRSLGEERGPDGKRFECDVVVSAEEALEALMAGGHEVFVTACEGNEELELIEAVRAGFPQVVVIAVSSKNDARLAVAVMKLGAADFLVKPVKVEQLLAAIEDATGRAADGDAEKQAVMTELKQVIDDPRMEVLNNAVNELEHVQNLTLEALGNSLDLKDTETEGHSKRVTAYTMALARAMGLPETELQVIARGAYLHDIGKMAVPDAILKKNGPLTTSEVTLMQTHSERGYSIIRKIPFLAGAADMVHAHQERFDGSGYPRGLKGEEIILGARIFAIADTLDAITSDRPYRRANSFEYARREIERCAGTQFDPAVVEAFLKIPISFWLQIREEILERQEELK
jgi:putative nucleotidyltransferase with HDIG domain